MTIKIQKTHGLATFEKAHPTDIGFDLTACDYEIKPQHDNLIMIDLGVRVEPPVGYYFKVYPRSSFSKSGFVLANSTGLIDQNYRGNWFFPVRYVGYMRHIGFDRLLVPLVGTRIAQAELCRIENNFNTMFVEELSTDTDRGVGGFGSTGK